MSELTFKRDRSHFVAEMVVADRFYGEEPTLDVTISEVTYRRFDQEATMFLNREDVEKLIEHLKDALSSKESDIND